MGPGDTLQIGEHCVKKNGKTGHQCTPGPLRHVIRTRGVIKQRRLNYYYCPFHYAAAKAWYDSGKSTMGWEEC